VQVKEIDAAELKARMDAGANLRLLDIRSDAELMAGILPNSEHLAMHLIPLKMSEFSASPDKEIVLYCRSGARSYHACMYLMQQGIENVVNLRGGIISWAQQGFEIRQPTRR
jgi:rhodanese-related sulfurtransferase